MNMVGSAEAQTTSNDPTLPADPANGRYPVLLRTLPPPDGFDDIVERHCRRYRLRRRDRATVEEQILLQYHFGGRLIPVASTPKGLMVLARSLPPPDSQARADFERLVREHISCLAYLSPPRWENSRTELR